MELGDQVVVRILGAEVGLGVTVFFVVSVGRVAPLDAGLVVIVADLAAVDSVGAEVTLCPRPASCNCSLILLTGVDGSIPWAFNRAANKAALLISVVDDGIVVVKPRPVRIALKKDSSS